MGTSRALCGILNLDKPPGMTSRDVVDLVSRPLRGVKVGHAGTLDPLATGVLVVCVGGATRLIDLVQRMPKTYRTVIRLGARSETLDADGTVVAVEDPEVPSEARVREALATQVGTIAQRPPEYSAVKLGGRRAYDLARAGTPVALEPRPVSVFGIELWSYAWPKLELEIHCGGGTYIRSIARDLGEELGCGGLVEVLIRTRIGSFPLEEAIDPRGLSAGSIPGLLRPAIVAASALPAIGLRPEQVVEIVHGRSVAFEGPLAILALEGEVALVGPDGELVAIGQKGAGDPLVRPRRVLTGARDPDASPRME